MLISVINRNPALVMFGTLLILIWQKKKKRERDIPPHKYVCLSQEAVRGQKPGDCKSSVLHGSIDKMVKRRGKLCALSYLRPP